MWAQPGIIRSKALPQAKEPFITNHFHQHLLQKKKEQERGGGGEKVRRGGEIDRGGKRENGQRKKEH